MSSSFTCIRHTTICSGRVRVTPAPRPRGRSKGGRVLTHFLVPSGGVLERCVPSWERPLSLGVCVPHSEEWCYERRTPDCSSRVSESRRDALCQVVGPSSSDPTSDLSLTFFRRQDSRSHVIPSRDPLRGPGKLSVYPHLSLIGKPIKTPESYSLKSRSSSIFVKRVTRGEDPSDLLNDTQCFRLDRIRNPEDPDRVGRPGFGVGGYSLDRGPKDCRDPCDLRCRLWELDTEDRSERTRPRLVYGNRGR